MLLCFVAFKVGGGDVKLIAMLGAFLGPQQGITAMLWTFVLAACMGLIVLIWRVGPMRTIVLAFRRIAFALAPMWFRPLTDEDHAQFQPPLFLAPARSGGGDDSVLCGGLPNLVNATMPSNRLKSHDFAALAKRISAWTTNSLLTLIVLVAGLGFGRQTLKWWAADASPSSVVALPTDSPDDLAQLHTLQFGDNSWSLRRRLVAGDKNKAVEQLRTACREVLVTGASADKPPTGEDRFLAFLAGSTPVDQEPGKWRLYELQETFPDDGRRGETLDAPAGAGETEPCPIRVSRGGVGTGIAGGRQAMDVEHVSVGGAFYRRTLWLE